MTGWKHVCSMIGVAILLAAGNTCSSAELKVPSKVAPETDSAVRPPNETGADRDRIIGKGIHTVEQFDRMPGSSLIRPAFGCETTPSELLDFARENPENEFADDILFRAAEWFVYEKEYERAISPLDTIIEQYPYSARVAIETLFHFIVSPPGGDTSEMREAKEAFFVHIRDHPNFTADKALREKALILETLGNRAEAIKLLQRYVDKHPRGRWATEDTRARPLFQWFGRVLYRTDELIFHHLAWLYHENGEHVKAQEVLNQAIETFVRSMYTISYYDLLARTYESTGDVAKERNALMHLKVLFRRNAHDRVEVVGGKRNRDDNSLRELWHPWLRVRPLDEVELRWRELQVNTRDRGT